MTPVNTLTLTGQHAHAHTPWRVPRVLCRRVRPLARPAVQWRAMSHTTIHMRCQGRPWIGAPVHRRSVGDRAGLRDRPERAGSAASGSVSSECRAILSHDTIRHDLSSVTCSAGGTAHLGSVWACPGTSSGCWRHLFPPPLCTATSAPAQKVSELVVAIL